MVFWGIKNEMGVMCLSNMLHQRKPQTTAAGCPSHATALEGLAQSRELFRRNTRPEIDHL